MPPVSSDYVILINSSQSQDLNKEVCDYVQNLLQVTQFVYSCSMYYIFFNNYLLLFQQVIYVLVFWSFNP